KPALEVLRTSLADREQLAKDYPSVLLYRQEVAETHNNLARALAADNRAADAEKEYEESLRIQRKLAADHPTVPQYRSRLGAMLDNVAAFHKEKKEGVPRALALLEEAT